MNLQSEISDLKSLLSLRPFRRRTVRGTRRGAASRAPSLPAAGAARGPGARLARDQQLIVVAHGSRSGGHELVALFESGQDLNGVAAFDAERDRHEGGAVL